LPFIHYLWVATLTSTRSDSGSESELVVIVNQDELDVVHRDLGIFGSVETGGGKVYRIDISEARVLPENYYYMRIGTRGSEPGCLK
jgi:predicted RNA-binding protein